MKFKYQHGFTFIELIVASLLSSILIGVLLVLLIQARRLTEFSVRAVTFNREARETFSLLGNGFVDNNKDRYVGLQGCFSRNDSNMTWRLDNKEYEFNKENKNNILIVKLKNQNPEHSTSISGVKCDDRPLGWVYNNEIKGDGQVKDLTRGVTLQLMDPFWIRDNFSDEGCSSYLASPRDTTTFRAAPSDIRESYRTAFYLPVDPNLTQ